MRRLHDLELPTAQLTWWTAEINRDREKQPQPFALDQFFWFKPRKAAADAVEVDPDAPSPDAGAAALKLLADDRLPPFAMALIEQLEDAGTGQPAPIRLALIAEDAILLAPRPAPGDAWRGFLIAEESASGQDRWFQADDGSGVLLSVPVLEAQGVAVAVGGATLPIRPSPEGCD